MESFCKFETQTTSLQWDSKQKIQQTFSKSESKHLNMASISTIKDLNIYIHIYKITSFSILLNSNKTILYTISLQVFFNKTG